MLCLYLRVVLGSELKGSVYARDFLLLNKNGESFQSNFSNYLKGIKKEGSFECCFGCASLNQVSYFKRRWGVFSERGLFLYRHHDDNAEDFVACLDLREENGRTVRAEEVPAMNEKRGGGECFWRVWLEEGEGAEKGVVMGKGGGRAEEERWSVMCKGTERGRADWLCALRGDERKDDQGGFGFGSLGGRGGEVLGENVIDGGKGEVEVDVNGAFLWKVEI